MEVVVLFNLVLWPSSRVIIPMWSAHWDLDQRDKQGGSNRRVTVLRRATSKADSRYP
jgi:hypothetical protein